CHESPLRLAGWVGKHRRLADVHARPRAALLSQRPMPREDAMPGFLADFSNELADAVERAGTSVISVPEGGREGVSGTIWREDVAITAEHTIRGLDEVEVVLPLG